MQIGGFLIKYKTALIIIALLLLVSISNVCATNLNESSQPISSNDNLGNFSQLDSEINDSYETKEVILTKDYCFDSDNDAKYSEGISIDIDNLTINGKGHTINANKKARIFNINANNIVLKNINLINGAAKSNGGAILWNGLNGTIINSNIKNSATPNIGGGAYFENPATIMNSSFENNSAYFGGGVNFEQEGTVINSNIKDNYATLLGGGIYFVKEGRVMNSTFVNNEGGDGGAIYFFRTGLVDNSKFEKNIAIGYGGGITADEDITVKNSQFISNIGMFAAAIYFKNTGIVENSIFNSNSAKRESGCLYFTRKGSVYNSTFTDNSGLWAGAILFDKEGTVNASTFISNKASADGGAIYVQGEINVNNSKFDNNIANSKGNSLYITSQKIILNNLTFASKSDYDDEVCINNPNISINNIVFKKVVETKVVEKIIKPKSKIKTSITAKSKTFKAKTKTKKITITLKGNGKLLNKKKVTLKVNKKTYTVKTNKGKATFKIKLTKKGKFSALIKFAGDSSYKASQKKITVKIK